MGVINPELKTFKQKVGPAIGSMSTASTKISDSIQELSTSAKSVRSDIDSNYDSVNKSTILGKFNEVDEMYTDIASSVESTLQSLISGAQGVIDLVTKLEGINEEIDAQQEIINSNSGTESAAVSARLNAQEIIDSKNKEFDETQERALTALSSLKAQDGSVQEAESLNTSSTSISTESLEYGTFELKSFTSSTGETIEYYVYVPKNAENVDSLPAMLYLHGSTSSYNDPGWSKYGLTGLIQLIKKKSLAKVDKELLILGGFYVVVLVVYFLFEKVVINYRPVLEKGALEASYPSSHTILSICVCLSSIMVASRIFKNKDFVKWFNVCTSLLMVGIVVTRLLSGVHWLTDIFGGILISLALCMLFHYLIGFVPKNKKSS